MHLCYCEMTSGLSELTMGTLQGHPREAPIARQLLELVAVEHAVLRPRAGHSGYPKFSGRVVRVLGISGFQK